MDPTQGDRESTRSPRQLRYIWLPDGRNFAEVLIAEGCGFEFTCRLLYRYRERSKAALRRAKLPPLRFHDLRHTCASLLLAQGVHPRVVMETLGHSQIGLTMNTYSHVIEEVRREAAARMEAVLGGGRTDERGETPVAVKPTSGEGEAGVSSEKDWSRARDSNPRPADYESLPRAAQADPGRPKPAKKQEAAMMRPSPGTWWCGLLWHRFGTDRRALPADAIATIPTGAATSTPRS
jgi:hypothetical protein